LNKILHAIPSPRDNIQGVLDYQPDLPFDRFIPKFMPEVDAYHLVRDFFLSHKQYTHLAIGTDDIVVKPEHMQALAADLAEKDYPVLTGVMNVFQEDHDLLNITPNGSNPSPIWAKRIYNWINKKEMYRYTANGTNPIIQVGFSGFPVMIIRRDIVERIAFESDAKYNPVPFPLGGSLDVQFCYSCHRMKIPIFCDTRVEMDHLRLSGQNRVGTARPHCIYWVKNTQIRYDIDYEEITIKYDEDTMMPGVLFCTKCEGEAEGHNFSEAASRLDHSIGRDRGIFCPASHDTLQWNGHGVIGKEPEKIKIPYLVKKT